MGTITDGRELNSTGYGDSWEQLCNLIQQNTGTYGNSPIMRHVTWAQQLPDCPQHFFQEVIWNNGWDFGDNIFIFKDLLHRCLVQIKSALGVPLSIQGCWKRVTPEDMVVHKKDVMYFNGKSWENLNSWDVI